MEMIISGVVNSEEGKLAYVLFKDSKRSAEGIIPACRITKNQGFSSEQVTRLEEYMRENLEDIKKEAVKNNPFNALMKE